MLKREDRPLFGALMFLVVAVLSLFLLQPFNAPPNGCEQQAGHHESFKECVEIASAQSVAVYTRLLAYFTAALAALTLALAGASIWQGYLTKQSINLARAEFIATHRPRVRVRQMWVISPKDQPVIIRFTIVNVGDSDANVNLIDFRINVWGPEVKSESERLEFDGGDLLAGQSEIIESSPASMLYAERAMYTVTGELEYADPNNVKRRTGISRRKETIGRRFVPGHDSEYEYED